MENELTSLIAKVPKGHLIELQETCGDWGPLAAVGGSSWGFRNIQGTCKKRTLTQWLL